MGQNCYITQSKLETFPIPPVPLPSFSSIIAAVPWFSLSSQPVLKCMPSPGFLMTHRALVVGCKLGGGRSLPACQHLESKAPEGRHKCSSLPEGHSSIHTVSTAIHQCVSLQLWLTCCRLISETDPARQSALPEGFHHQDDAMTSLLSMDMFPSSIK